MRKTTVALLPALAAIALVAQAIGGPRADDTALDVSMPRVHVGAEMQAAELLEAMKQGDAHTFLRRLDLIALYKQHRLEGDEETTFWAFVAKARRAVKAEFGDAPAEGFDYTIVGSRTEAAETIVTVKVRHAKDAEWQEHQLPFARKNDRWKITVEGMKAFDFGFGAPGPIRRGADTAVEAMKHILDGVKRGDATVLLDHLDLKGMYEQMVPEQVREQITLEEFEKLVREGAQREQEAPEGFDYEILGSRLKGDATIVRVKVKEDTDAEWEEHEVEFKKIDGTWKITAEGMERLMMQEAVE